jgi:enterochelin esterase-like enzyme
MLLVSVPGHQPHYPSFDLGFPLARRIRFSSYSCSIFAKMEAKGPQLAQIFMASAPNAAIHSLHEAYSVFRVLLICSTAFAVALLSIQPLQSQNNAKGKGSGLIQPLAEMEKGLKGKLERIKVHGKSLEGNLEGDSPDREVFVYLPPSYQSNPNRRYPVVYTLHGYGLHAEQWIGFANYGSLERDITAGTAKEMILVAPDAFTLHNGSFYSNSRTTGDWDTFLGVELISYIDSHYRTIAERASRGLMGHSMGGYGTLRLAMKHPEMYSNIFAMSPCCMLETGEASAAIVELEAKIKTREDAAKLSFNQKSPLARGAAWSSNPGYGPLFLDLPVRDGKPQPFVAAKWMANSLMVMLEQYAPSLKKMNAIRMNVGTQEPLLGPNQEMDEALKHAGVEHTLEIFEGDHNGQVPTNFETKVLPFFSQQLKF